MTQRGPLPYVIVDRMPGHTLSSRGEGYISAPCDTLNQEWREWGGCKSEDSSNAKGTKVANVDMVRALGGYPAALVYVSQRASLPLVVDELKHLIKGFLFQVELGYRVGLDMGRLPGDLRQEFQKKGIILSQDVAVVVEEAGSRWAVQDKEHGRFYLVKRENMALNIYRGSGHPALFIHPTYDNALVRFGFISKVMDMLKKPYGLFFLLFLGVLLWVQMGIVVSHRRRNYGIFLAKGMFWRQIHGMVLVQVALSFLVSLGIAMAALVSMHFFLSAGVSNILDDHPYREHIFTSLDLLPFMWDYLWVVVVSLFFSCLMAILQLLSEGIRPDLRLLKRESMEPARLLHS